MVKGVTRLANGQGLELFGEEKGDGNFSLGAFTNGKGDLASSVSCRIDSLWNEVSI